MTFPVHYVPVNISWAFALAVEAITAVDITKITQQVSDPSAILFWVPEQVVIPPNIKMMVPVYRYETSLQDFVHASQCVRDLVVLPTSGMVATAANKSFRIWNASFSTESTNIFQHVLLGVRSDLPQKVVQLKSDDRSPELKRAPVQCTLNVKNAECSVTSYSLATHGSKR